MSEETSGCHNLGEGVHIGSGQNAGKHPTICRTAPYSTGSPAPNANSAQPCSRQGALSPYALHVLGSVPRATVDIKLDKRWNLPEGMQPYSRV